MSEPEERWAPLESNPTALNQFAKLLGVDMERVAFCDCWGLEEELLAFLPQPCYALILLFPFPLPATKEESDMKPDNHSHTHQVTWIQQQIGNACGTMAAMHALCHAVQQEPSLAGPHSDMGQFVAQLPPLSGEERGHLLRSFAAIRQAHEAVVNLGDTEAPDASSEVNHHFTCFVHSQGHLWELDGRQAGPLCHRSDCTEEQFVYQAAQVIKKKFIEQVSAEETGFSVLALGPPQ